MIIWLSSYPRSGNTFFRIVAHQIFGISTYSGFQSGNADLDRVGMGDITGHETLPADLEKGRFSICCASIASVTNRCGVRFTSPTTST